MATSARRRAAWFTVVAAITTSSAACTIWRRSQTPPPFRVVERLVDRLERNQRGSGIDRDVSVAARVPHRWTAAEVERQWVHVAGADGATFRSPRLDVGTIDDLDALVVTLGPGSNRAVLLWNDLPALSRAEYTRNRRDLQPREHLASTVVIRAKDIRRDVPSTIRYLFLHLPGARRPDAFVESIAVVARADQLEQSTSGVSRLTIRGELRDVVYNGAGPIEWPVELPHGAELRFGVRARDVDSVIHARVTLSAAGRTSTIFDRTLDGADWHEARVDVPPGPCVLRFMAEGAVPGQWMMSGTRTSSSYTDSP